MTLTLLVTGLSVGVTVSAIALPVGSTHVSTLAAFTSPYDTEVKFDVSNSWERQVCAPGGPCICTLGQTVLGTKIICVKCTDSGSQGCDATCSTDSDDCRKCLQMCPNVLGCKCVIDCMHKCSLKENPITRIAVSCGILFLATAALAFFFKVFLMCCLNTVGRSHSRYEEDAASLNSVDQFVAQRLRDAPPRYDSLVGPNGPNSQIGERRPSPQNVPPDKPPPYKQRPSRGELCLQVSTLPCAPPPYSVPVSYLDTPPLPTTDGDT